MNAKKDNGLAFHHQKTGHDFDFDNTEILQQDKNYWRRLILEGIEIKYNENLVNLQSGTHDWQVLDTFPWQNRESADLNLENSTVNMRGD